MAMMLVREMGGRIVGTVKISRTADGRIHRDFHFGSMVYAAWR